MFDASNGMLNGHPQGFEVGIFGVLHAIIVLFLFKLQLLLGLALARLLNLFNSTSRQLHKHLLIQYFSLLSNVVLDSLIRVICKFL
jgi:hypothetical protein